MFFRIASSTNTKIGFTAITLLSVATFAQKQFSISGSVVDSISGKAVELATIALKITGDDKIVIAGTADLDGKFYFPKVAEGKYDLFFSFVGYNAQKLSIELYADKNLGPIKLSTSSKVLHETTVTAQKALIVKTSEKTVVLRGDCFSIPLKSGVSDSGSMFMKHR